jgi:nitrogen fixation NifU-like protein
MQYTSQVIDHAQNPRNIGYIEDADGTGQFGDPDCGDFAIMTIEVHGDRIRQCKYLVRGCGAAIATCSIASEMVVGKTLGKAMEIDDQAVLDALGGLPEAKVHCSNLAACALQNAITDYQKRQKTNLRNWRAMYQGHR